MIGGWLKARKADEVSVQQACQPTHPLKRHPDQRYQKPGKGRSGARPLRPYAGGYRY